MHHLAPQRCCPTGPHRLRAHHHTHHLQARDSKRATELRQDQSSTPLTEDACCVIAAAEHDASAQVAAHLRQRQRIDAHAGPFQDCVILLQRIPHDGVPDTSTSQGGTNNQTAGCVAACTHIRGRDSTPCKTTRAHTHTNTHRIATKSECGCCIQPEALWVT